MSPMNERDQQRMAGPAPAYRKAMVTQITTPWSRGASQKCTKPRGGWAATAEQAQNTTAIVDTGSPKLEQLEN